jgi:hypothetical protein
MINIHIAINVSGVDCMYDEWMDWKMYLMDLVLDWGICGLYGIVGMGLCFGWLWGFSRFYESLNDWMDDFVGDVDLHKKCV